MGREAELRERTAREQANAAMTVQTQGSSWYHNSSLTGHASKVYASLQKMMDAEKARKQNKAKPQSESTSESKEKDTDGAANKLKSQYEDEANSGMDSADDGGDANDEEKKERNAADE